MRKKAILAAFLHSEAENADAAKKRELIEAEKEAMHLFSLLHAIALTNLSQTTGQVYGRISPDGAMHFKAFRFPRKSSALADDKVAKCQWTSQDLCQCVHYVTCSA